MIDPLDLPSPRPWRIVRQRPDRPGEATLNIADATGRHIQSDPYDGLSEGDIQLVVFAVNRLTEEEYADFMAHKFVSDFDTTKDPSE